jgi:hypothetical protein
VADNNCTVCGDEIQIQIFKGTGTCCITCQKVKSGEMDRVTARAFKPSIPLEDNQWRPETVHA